MLKDPEMKELAEEEIKNNKEKQTTFRRNEKWQRKNIQLQLQVVEVHLHQVSY